MPEPTAFRRADHHRLQPHAARSLEQDDVARSQTGQDCIYVVNCFYMTRPLTSLRRTREALEP